MKKTCGIMLCLLAAGLLLAGSFAAAESESGDSPLPLTRLYEACARLLTGETSMTLEGSANFSLDGTLFKHAEGLCAQEGANAYQQLELRTPRADGSLLESGYAVWDRNGSGFSVERWAGNVRASRVVNPPKEQALRPSVASGTLLGFCRGAAEFLDDRLAEQTLETVTDAGLEITMHLSEKQVPVLMNAGLNLLFQFGARHFFGLDYHDMPTEGWASIGDYLTVTQGILYCARELSIRDLSFTASLDPAGNLTLLQGETRICLLCRDGSLSLLDVSFSLTGKDYGSTVVREVIPEKNLPENLPWISSSAENLPDYFSTFESGGRQWSEYGLPSVVFPKTVLYHRELHGPEDAAAYADEIARLDALAFGEADRLTWSVSVLPEGDRYEALGYLPEASDAPALSLLFASDGTVLRIRNLLAGYDEAEPFWDDSLESDWQTLWRGEIALMLWCFEENLNPGATMISDADLLEMRKAGNGFASYSDTLSAGDRRYLLEYGTLYRNPAEKVRFTVQFAPVLRVVEMDATIDPLEGGNG